MTDFPQRVLLERLAKARGIPFRFDLLPMREQFTTVDGRKLSALHWRGRGKPLMLLHGGALTGQTWDLLCLALADEAECVAVDLAGHGSSDWADVYTIESSAMDVEAIANELCWQQFHLAGMSLGGNVAFHFVATHPARALSLTMVDVGPHVDFGATANMRDFVDNANQWATFEELIAAALKASPKSDPDLMRYRYGTLVHLAADGSWSWRQDRRKPHDFEHILGKLRAMPALVRRVTCPVLIARGGRSRVISDNDAREFAAMFVNGTAVTISEAGHNIQEDNPKGLAAALRAITQKS